MNHPLFTVRIGALVIAAAAFVACDRNPFKAHEHVNRGSCLQAVEAAISAVRNYAKARNHFPQTTANLAELGEFSVLPEVAAILQYGGNDSLNLESPERIIVLK